MALNVTVGGTAADSYATLAEWAAWAVSMGYTLTGDDTAREASLRRAAAAMDDIYRFRGYPTNREQARQWPRAEVGVVRGWEVLVDVIPTAIKRGQMELAYAMQNGTDPLAVIEATVASESSSVGPLSKSVTYLGGKRGPTLPAVDRALMPYIAAGAANMEMLRA